MKLDWELVRSVMTEIEDMTPQQRHAVRFSTLYEDNGEDAIKCRHVLLFRDAGYIKGIPVDTLEGAGLLNPELTFDGHQLLATMRSKDVWERLKTIAKTSGVALSLEAVKIGSKLALEHVMKAPPGGGSGSGVSV